MVIVKTARAIVDTVNRLRSGWRFGGRQLIRGSFRLYTWQQTRSPLPVDSHRVHPTCCFFAVQTYCTTFINRAYFKKA
jgi:hypothetical protein